MDETPPNTPGMFDMRDYRIWRGHLWKRRNFHIEASGESYPNWEDKGEIQEDGGVSRRGEAPIPQPVSWTRKNACQMCGSPLAPDAQSCPVCGD